LNFTLDSEVFTFKQVPDENERWGTSDDESDYGDDGFIRHSTHGIRLFGQETCVPVA